MDNLQHNDTYWKKVVWVLCFGWIAIWIYRTILNPLLPLLKTEFGIESDATIGLISTAYFFGYTVMQIPSGILADKVGRKKIMIPGFLLFAIGPILIGVTPIFSLVIVASVIAGIGSGAYYGTAYATSSETIPEEKRGFSTAIINSGSAVGMTIGLLGASWFVLDMGFNWRILLFISAAIIVVMAIVFGLVLKEKPRSKNVKETNKEDAEDKVSLKVLLSESRILSAYLLYFATCYAYYMIVTWLPAFLQQERGFEGSAIGLASSLVAIAAIPGALIFSKFSDMYANKKLSFIISLEIAVVLVVFLIVTVTQNWLVVAMLILYGLLGKLAVEPILISHMSTIAPKKGYGTFFGFFNFFGMSSSIVAPFLTGLIADATGSRVIAFYIAAVILIIAIIFFAIANRKKTTGIAA